MQTYPITQWFSQTHLAGPCRLSPGPRAVLCISQLAPSDNDVLIPMLISTLAAQCGCGHSTSRFKSRLREAT